jgi:hypothetical protein
VLWFLLFDPKVGPFGLGDFRSQSWFGLGDFQLALEEFRPDSPKVPKVTPWTGGFSVSHCSQLTQISVYTSENWHAYTLRLPQPHAFYFTELAAAVLEILSLDWGIFWRDLGQNSP